MKRRFTAILLTVAMLTFTGCGSAGSGTPPSSAPAPAAPTAAPEAPTAAPEVPATKEAAKETEEPVVEIAPETKTSPVTLNFVVQNSEPFLTAWREMVDKYMAETGNTITLDPIPWTNMLETQTLAFASGSGTYNGMKLHPSWWSQFVDKGYVAPLNDYLTEEELAEYEPSLMALFSKNDKYYAIPDMVGFIMMAYRTDVFEELGLSAPTNFDALLAAADAVKNSGKDMYGIAFPGTNQSSLAGTFLTALLANGSWILKEDGSPNVNTPEMLDTMRFFQKLAPYAPPGFMGFHWEETYAAASGGQAAMSLLMSTRLMHLEDPERSQVTGVWGFVPLKNTTSGGAIDPWAWGIAANGDKQEAAADFIQYMNKTETAIEISKLANTVGATKAFFADADRQASLPFLSGMGDVMQANAKGMPSWDTWKSEADTLEINMQRMFNGEMTPEQVIEAVSEIMVANRS